MLNISIGKKYKIKYVCSIYIPNTYYLAVGNIIHCVFQMYSCVLKYFICKRFNGNLTTYLGTLV